MNRMTNVTSAFALLALAGTPCLAQPKDYDANIQAHIVTIDPADQNTVSSMWSMSSTEDGRTIKLEGRNGLISAEIETLPNEDAVTPASALCAEVLRAIIEKIGAEHFPAPHRFDDAAWIGYRLSEILPIDRDTRQRMLLLSDPHERLAQLERVLTEQGTPRAGR